MEEDKERQEEKKNDQEEDREQDMSARHESEPSVLTLMWEETEWTTTSCIGERTTENEKKKNRIEWRMEWKKNGMKKEKQEQEQDSARVQE